MAKARMLHKKISVSLDVDNLSSEAQLLFTWMIAHADDDGRMKGEPQFVKANVVPMKKWSFQKVKNYLIEMKTQGLIQYWEQNSEWFIEFPKWNDYQQIRKDRYEKSKLPSFNKEKGNQVSTKQQPDDTQVAAQSNVVESSPEEIKISESSDKDEIAEKNFPYKEGQPKVGFVDPTTGGNSKRGFVALEIFKRMEPGNLKAMGNYVNWVKVIPVDLMFQWASEIEQDATIKNRGAVFNAKVKEYLANKEVKT